MVKKRGERKRKRAGQNILGRKYRRNGALTGKERRKRAREGHGERTEGIKKQVKKKNLGKKTKT